MQSLPTDRLPPPPVSPPPSPVLPKGDLKLDPVAPNTPTHLAFLVNNQLRLLLPEWWDALEGPKPPTTYQCNGCTAAPDVWRGYVLWPACVIHDWHYDVDGPDISRKEADAIFRRNVRTLLGLQECPEWEAGALTRAYWWGVRKFGSGAYKATHWTDAMAGVVKGVVSILGPIRGFLRFR